jgi:hypothetical protein
VKTRVLREDVIERFRLGRHVEHDPRSRQYRWPGEITHFDDLRTVVHRHYGPVLDQGNLGSCTGNAISQCCNTAPTHVPGTRLLIERDAISIYGKATQVDEFPDAYPPIDTGSSGLAVCKIAKSLNLIKEYRHAFSIEEAISALQDRPVITGIPWLEAMDYPDHNGLVRVEGQVRGGHEIVGVGVHIPNYAKSILDLIVEFINSWSKGWGLRGRFYMEARGWAKLLENDGDVSIPVR